MSNENHIFSNKPTRAKTQQRVLFWLFRTLTYFIILCNVYLFRYYSQRIENSFHKQSAVYQY